MDHKSSLHTLQLIGGYTWKAHQKCPKFSYFITCKSCFIFYITLARKLQILAWNISYWVKGGKKIVEPRFYACMGDYPPAKLMVHLLKEADKPCNFSVGLISA